MNKSMKAVYSIALEKHQRNNPGCKLNEKICTRDLSKECVGKGDISEFVPRRENICRPCEAVKMRKYYEEVIYPKRVAERARKRKEKKEKRSISFKKGTKKE